MSYIASWNIELKCSWKPLLSSHSYWDCFLSINRSAFSYFYFRRRSYSFLRVRVYKWTTTTRFDPVKYVIRWLNNLHNIRTVKLIRIKKSANWTVLILCRLSSQLMKYLTESKRVVVVHLYTHILKIVGLLKRVWLKISLVTNI
jgi:hypothetical protein